MRVAEELKNNNRFDEVLLKIKTLFHVKQFHSAGF